MVRRLGSKDAAAAAALYNAAMGQYELAAVMTPVSRLFVLFCAISILQARDTSHSASGMQRGKHAPTRWPG